MKTKLLNYLCDPVDKSGLNLDRPIYDENGEIITGSLISKSGRVYPIIDKIPRFAKNPALKKSVESFGREWDYFNYNDFKIHWLNHTVKNTFGSPDIFRGKIIVDAGGGAGMQSFWMSQYGADYVLCLELSGSVDGILKENLGDVDNVEIIQCSIDQPPIKNNIIDGMVICHNVIHHTASVENTARALWKIVAKGGEFVFNCYGKNDKGFLRKIRFNFHLLMRKILSRLPFGLLLTYAKLVSVIRFIPFLGWILEKSSFVIRGDVPRGPRYLKRLYKASVLNTFDGYGSHQYQHIKSEEEIKRLVDELQPDKNKILNFEKYFSRPAPIGCALRLFK